MDRDEVRRRAAERGRRWRENVTPEERQAHYQRAAATRRQSRAALGARKAEQRQAAAVRQAHALERAQQPLAEATRQARRIKREQQRQEAKAAANIRRRPLIFSSYVDVVSPHECWQWLGSSCTGYGCPRLVGHLDVRGDSSHSCEMNSCSPARGRLGIDVCFQL